MGTATSITPGHEVDLETERAALAHARTAVDAKLDRLSRHLGRRRRRAGRRVHRRRGAPARSTSCSTSWSCSAASTTTTPGGSASTASTAAASSSCIDWRAPFAGGFYQARLDDPLGLARRVSYVGMHRRPVHRGLRHRARCRGSSPLLAELSRSRGTEMRAAVATLQSEQDALVRLDPDRPPGAAGRSGHRQDGGRPPPGRVARLQRHPRHRRPHPRARSERPVPALRLRRAADAGRGPHHPDHLRAPARARSERGRRATSGWLEVLDRFEADLLRPRRGEGRLPADAPRTRWPSWSSGSRSRPLPWRDRRKVFVRRARRPARGTRGRGQQGGGRRVAVDHAAGRGPGCAAERLLGAWAPARGALDDWLAGAADGALLDEVRARFEGVPARYGHVIVDEAQDLSLLQLRAVHAPLRAGSRSSATTPSARRPTASACGRAADAARRDPAEMATAYRMSAEIADWLNEHAASPRHRRRASWSASVPPASPSRDVDRSPARPTSSARPWENVALIERRRGLEPQGRRVRRRAWSTPPA